MRPSAVIASRRRVGEHDAMQHGFADVEHQACQQAREHDSHRRSWSARRGEVPLDVVDDRLIARLEEATHRDRLFVGPEARGSRRARSVLPLSTGASVMTVHVVFQAFLNGNDCGVFAIRSAIIVGGS